jgi:NADH:ubiquinone oxidoreductase subunit C
MSNRTEICDLALQIARELLGTCAHESEQPEPNRLDVRIALTDLVTLAGRLQAAHWGYLSAITGLDCGTQDGDLEVLYHFCKGGAILTLRVRTPRVAPSVPSLYTTWPAANFFERELSEMFGITVMDTPNADRLLLPDDWPTGEYPLRKDYVPAPVEP